MNKQQATVHACRQQMHCIVFAEQVASVAATANGVAPGALLGSYRVFGCQGSATDDVIIEAIDRAVRDGCDIINLSLSSGAGCADNVRNRQKKQEDNTHIYRRYHPCPGNNATGPASPEEDSKPSASSTVVLCLHA